jgi:hypothetical protein
MLSLNYDNFAFIFPKTNFAANYVLNHQIRSLNVAFLSTKMRSAFMLFLSAFSLITADSPLVLITLLAISFPFSSAMAFVRLRLLPKSSNLIFLF